MGHQKHEDHIKQICHIDKASLLKSTVSQQTERMEIKDESQRVDVDATQSSPVGSVSVGISPMTLGGDCVVVLDVEHVELIAAKGIKLNPLK